MNSKAIGSLEYSPLPAWRPQLFRAFSIGNLIGTNYHDTYCHIFDAVRPKCCTKGGTKPPRYTSALPGVDAVASSLANRQAPDAGMRSFGS